ncbi:hypothetical protein N7526_007742 [Penicillium atrosanguineum]|nr:hypothetical protein N7526_007742 [Penicillium atrosanguineum]
MAYDGYHQSSKPYQMGNMNPDPNLQGYSPTPPYPSLHEPDRINMPQPQMSGTSAAPKMEPYTQSPYAQSTENLNDAVSSAVHNNVSSPSYLSPDVLSQITATVIQQLKASGLNNIQGSAPSPASVPPPRSQSQQPPFPTTEYPPRPHSESPPNAQRSGSLPTPNPMSNSYDPSTFPAPSGYSSDSRPNPKPTPDPPLRRRDSISSHGSHKADVTRPKPPSRDATAMEMTTLERIWGKLFEDGKPTKRLGQFLRGIAMHLIEDYPPGNTLVIVPHKLQKFYADTDVSWDAYPWQDIFDDRTSSISRLFRDVKAQHHLVQTEELKDRPDIPGLTPKGFELWATLMIQANPEREYERLQKAVLNMPISNPDDKKERFPKEMPRRLFPEVADISLREELEEYIMKHCGVDLPPVTEEERSQAERSRKLSPSSVPSSNERARSYERGRPPPSASSSSAVINDEDEPIPSAPIERERKPYSAQPGGGKKYDELGHKKELGHTRSRTGSFTSRPPDIPRPSDKFDSMYSSRSGSGPAPARRFSRESRSSSRGMGHEYRHSESDLLDRDRAPRYNGVSAQDLYSEPTSMLPEEDGRRYRDTKAHRSSRAAPEDEYYRGMLGGQGGGSKYYH